MKRMLLGLPLLLPVLLAACGSARGLQPPPGVPLPVAALGAARPKTETELVTPTSQQRPERSDDLLRNGEQRRADEFDLPPER